MARKVEGASVCKQAQSNVCDLSIDGGENRSESAAFVTVMKASKRAHTHTHTHIQPHTQTHAHARARVHTNTHT